MACGSPPPSSPKQAADLALQPNQRNQSSPDPGTKSALEQVYRESTTLEPMQVDAGDRAYRRGRSRTKDSSNILDRRSRSLSPEQTSVRSRSRSPLSLTSETLKVAGQNLTKREDLYDQKKIKNFVAGLEGSTVFSSVIPLLQKAAPGNYREKYKKHDKSTHFYFENTQLCYQVGLGVSENLAKIIGQEVNHMELMVTPSHILLLTPKAIPGTTPKNPALVCRQRLDAMFERDRYLQHLRNSPSLPFHSQYYEITQIPSSQQLMVTLLSKAQYLLRPRLIQDALGGKVEKVMSIPDSPSKILTLHAIASTADDIRFFPESSSANSPGFCKWQIWPNISIRFKVGTPFEAMKVVENLTHYLRALISGTEESASEYYAYLSGDSNAPSTLIQNLQTSFSALNLEGTGPN